MIGDARIEILTVETQSFFKTHWSDEYVRFDALKWDRRDNALIDSISHSNKTLSKFTSIITILLLCMLLSPSSYSAEQETMIDLLQTINPDIKNMVLPDSLSEIRNLPVTDTKVAETLISIIKSGGTYRMIAIVALGKIHPPNAVEVLVGLLNDGSPAIRSQAALSLGEIKDKRAIDPLGKTMKDRKLWTDYPSPPARALLMIGDLGLDSLISGLKDDDPHVRMDAAIALQYTKDRRTIEALIKSLTDKDSNVRLAAVISLSASGDQRAVEPLINMLTAGSMKKITLLEDGYPERLKWVYDQDDKIRSEAANGLGKLKDRKALMPLIKALKDDEPNVRLKAASSLGMIKDSDALGPLIAALDDKNDNVRSAVANALGEVGDQRAISALVNKLVDWKIKKDVASSLSRLGCKPESVEDKIHFLIAQEQGKRKDWFFFSGLDWDLTRRILLRDADSANNIIRLYAVYAIISIGKEEMIDWLVERIDTEGDVNIAEAYINSGVYKLKIAGRNWAIKRNYKETTGQSLDLYWGR